jgi:restriction endonuclease S subunit
MKQSVIQYQRLIRWDVKSFLLNMKSVFPIVELGDYVYEHSEKVKVYEEPDKEFPILGVTNKEGVYLNIWEKGSNINQAYKKVRAGELVYNPYRVNVGSIGIVPKEYNGYYVSPAYVVFGTKEGLSNEYLYLLLSSNWFNPFLRAATSGSVRQNLTYDLLTQLSIPTPSLSVQEKIVDNWHVAKTKINDFKKDIYNKEQSIENYLLKEIGIVKKDSEKKKKGFVVLYKNLERWDTYFYKDTFYSIEKQFKNIEHDYLGSLAEFVSRSWSNEDFQSGVFNYVQISDVNKSKGIYNYEEVALNEAPSRATQVILEGDIIISTTRPYLAAFSEVKSDYSGCVASSGFSVIKDTKEKLDKKFLLEFLKSYTGIKQLEQRMTGGSYPAITQEELQKIKIPTPTITKQKDIVKNIKNTRLEISELSKKSDKLLFNIKNGLENVVSGKIKI